MGEDVEGTDQKNFLQCIQTLPTEDGSREYLAEFEKTACTASLDDGRHGQHGQHGQHTIRISELCGGH